MANNFGGHEFDGDFDFRFNEGETYPQQPLFSYMNSQDQFYQTPPVPLGPSPSTSSGIYQQAQTSQDHVINSRIPAGPAANYNLDQSLGHNYSSAPQIINFSSSSPEVDYSLEGNFRAAPPPAPTRTPVEAEYHRRAESKRRNEQAQLFVSLSKVVPGLTKLDRASILEHATDYLKALQERVRILEEQGQTSHNALDNHEQQQHNNNNSNTTDNDVMNESAVQETITARISKRNVLITICCKRNEKLLPKIPYEIEKMHLNVMDIRVMPFGGVYFHITIHAQMDNEFYGTVNEIVDHLRNILLSPPASRLMQNDGWISNSSSGRAAANQ